MRVGNVIGNCQSRSRNSIKSNEGIDNNTSHKSMQGLAIVSDNKAGEKPFAIEQRL